MGARSWSTPSPPPPPPPPGPLLHSCTSPASPSSSPPISPSPSPVTYQQYQRKRQQHPQAHHSGRSKTPQHPHPAHVGYHQITDLPLPTHVYPAGAWPSSATIPVGGGHPPGAGTDPVAVAAAVTQRLERHLSVRQDLALNLPTCLPLPDGEERPYGSSTRLRIRDYDQESEIYRECIRPPPNRTVFESGEPALIPFRCNSVGILSDASVTAKQSASSSSSSSSSPSSLANCGTAVCRGGFWDKDKEVHLSPSSRVVLDINGLPVVMRSKSMSTGSSSSLIQQPPPHQLAVMVPVGNNGGHCSGSGKRQNKTPAVSASPLASSSSSSSSSSPAHAACPSKDSSGKSLEAAVKSCVRSFFRDKVSSVRSESKGSASSSSTPIPPVTPAPSSHPPVNVGGVDNAAFESSCGQVSVSPSDARLRQHKHKQPVQPVPSRPESSAAHTRPARQQSTAATCSPNASARCRKGQHPPPPSLTGDSNSSSSKLASLPVVSCLTFSHGESPRPPPSSQT